MKKKFFLICFSSFLAFSCLNNNRHNLDESSYQKVNSILDKKNELSEPEDYIYWVKEIKKVFGSKNKLDQYITLLGELAGKENDLKIKSIYYFLISDFYWEQDNKEIGILFMTKVSDSVYDVVYDYNEIGYLVAKKIVSFEKNTAIKERMYYVLLNKYTDKIDIPEVYLGLSDYYKAVYDISESINILNKCLSYVTENDYQKEGVDLKAKIEAEIDFYKAKKTWIYEDLDLLINKIKYAIKLKDRKLIDQYASPFNFTVKLSQKNDFQNLTYEELEIEKKISSRISFSNTLENISNNDEAFLKTTGWDFPQISTWYFYFKKVYYPYDNNINGAWEWSGIYFGNFY